MERNWAFFSCCRVGVSLEFRDQSSLNKDHSNENKQQSLWNGKLHLQSQLCAAYRWSSPYQMQEVSFNPVLPASVILFTFLNTYQFVTIPGHQCLQTKSLKYMEISSIKQREGKIAVASYHSWSSCQENSNQPKPECIQDGNSILEWNFPSALLTFPLIFSHTWVGSVHTNWWVIEVLVQYMQIVFLFFFKAINKKIIRFHDQWSGLLYQPVLC